MIPVRLMHHRCCARAVLLLGLLCAVPVTSRVRRDGEEPVEADPCLLFGDVDPTACDGRAPPQVVDDRAAVDGPYEWGGTGRYPRPQECVDLEHLFPPSAEANDGGSSARPSRAADSRRWAAATRVRDIVLPDGRLTNDWLPPSPDDDAYATPNGRCDIDRVAAADMTPERFATEFAEKRPVIIVNATDNRRFRSLTRRAALLYCHGDVEVSARKTEYPSRETEANSYYVSMGEYITKLTRRREFHETNSGGGWYMFTPSDLAMTQFRELFSTFRPPLRYLEAAYPGTQGAYAYSFGVGGPLTGVPWHDHSAVFAETVHGKKRWWLRSKKLPAPSFPLDKTSLAYAVELPSLAPGARDGVLDCTTGPGETLYVPGLWHHSTLNLGETVILSTFVLHTPEEPTGSSNTRIRNEGSFRDG